MRNFRQNDRRGFSEGSRGGFNRESRGGSRNSEFGGRSRGFGGRDREFSRGPAEMYDATCSKCGKKCQVPFRPTGSKPVFCRDCFRQNENGGSSFAPRSHDRPAQTQIQTGISQEQFKQLNAKLDRILLVLQDLEIDVDAEEDDVEDDEAADLDEDDEDLDDKTNNEDETEDDDSDEDTEIVA